MTLSRDDPAGRKAVRHLNRKDERVPVNASRLAPNNSHGLDFQGQGYYQDEPFCCRGCGRAQVWTARQQKWWFEVVRGRVYGRPIRCRACRQREHARQAEARRVHLEGIAMQGVQPHQR